MVQQLLGDGHKEGALATAMRLHPRCRLAWYMDHSTNHRAKAPGALDASVFTAKDNGKNFPKDMRDGWFVLPNTTTRIMQSFYFVNAQTGARSCKGLVTVLKERQLWRENMTKPEMENLLSQRPDFLEQLP